ncbi:SAP30-binding protein [Procambarus clarkii]|uniref:SAP30-binding protein n=1 Tax=Procambarus clarkii TaxID=6728 RepID=UPI001E673151|nr:SAP30-binding protein-like [Procambarus clarkii]XP_045595044.1 SAP30-binding protein-like [Procambarus clarkii]XP_045595045.1 SAP30-binding protein-like [Procambarus clarkii]XP_045595046.1 SAP30-binding protein-like [Procambarus clarkii]
MSLGQLTANYTDSEGEDDDRMSDDSSHKSSSLGGTRIFELREEGRGTPYSVESGGSGTTTPQKKLNRLVSYANEEDDDEGEELGRDRDEDEPDEMLNSEPMDTGTDEGEDDKAKVKSHGVKLPAPPPGKCPQHLQDKVIRCLNEVRRGNKDYNAMIQNNKEFRNPGIYEKLIDLLQLDEMGTNYPLDMFDPHSWGKESYYDELARVQKEEMDKREKERKDKTKVDIISGTKKPLEEEAKKRKSRFDQGGPSNNVIKPMIVPPTLTSVPSGTKATIDAFGSLKKTK